MNLLEYRGVEWEYEYLAIWFPENDIDIIERYCEVGGTSPGGNIDTYQPADRDALLNALGLRDYQVKEGS